MKKIDKEFVVSILYSLVIPATFYFIVKLFQRNFHVILASIDNKIPFIPHFIYFYIFFFPFTIFVLYLIYKHDKKIYHSCIKATIIGLLITETIYLIYPTIIYRPAVDTNVDLITRWLINTTYFIDTPAINCFPSIHALLCFQISCAIILCKNINFKYKVMVLIMTFLILLSTVLVKQHYFYDIIASFLIFTFSNVVLYFNNSKLLKKLTKIVDI